jgi:FtsP/CotA-like multicopper oxidase with cupredoxin domain
MKRIDIKNSVWVPVLIAALLFLWGGDARATIDGVSGTTFNLAARQDHIVTSDGDSILMWGYALGAARMQYPGPTLILTEGDSVTITLKNELPAQAGNVSIVFPGLQVTAAGGVPGLLTHEAPPGGTIRVTYTFTADQPGTYLYRSGTRAGLQVEMGLVGAIIVRPALGAGFAYNHADTQFDREFLYLMTEMDPRIHRYVEFGQWDLIDMTTYFATNWFINGRNFPDLMAEAGVPWLPTQPYNCQPIMHPGDKTLVRYIGAGRDLHPMHFHGNDFEVIAVDGRMLSGVAGADLAWQATTVSSVPGQTLDFIWQWTGANLGWDVYGHPTNDIATLEPFEDLANHGKPFPVILPTRDSLTFGEVYPGSPFLGGQGDLPPGHPGLNSFGGYFFIWHSHTEKEITSNDIFPGGAITLMIVAPPSVLLD